MRVCASPSARDEAPRPHSSSVSSVCVSTGPGAGPPPPSPPLPIAKRTDRPWLAQQHRLLAVLYRTQQDAREVLGLVRTTTTGMKYEVVTALAPRLDCAPAAVRRSSLMKNTNNSTSIPFFTIVIVKVPRCRIAPLYCRQTHRKHPLLPLLPRRTLLLLPKLRYNNACCPARILPTTATKHTQDDPSWPIGAKGHKLSSHVRIPRSETPPPSPTPS